MSILSKIEKEIDLLDPAAFQGLCEHYLTHLGYRNPVSLGSMTGGKKTTKGTPDTYFYEAGQYTFVEYTTQKRDLRKKIKEDIEKCLNENITGIKVQDLKKIIYCHTSSNLCAKDDKVLHDLCRKQNVGLEIIGINALAKAIYEYPLLVKDHLGIEMSPYIYDYDHFVAPGNADMTPHLDNIFLFREQEITLLEKEIASHNVIVVSGNAGVGKTKLCLHFCKEYAEQNGYIFYAIKSYHAPSHSDIKLYFREDKKYILLIDDANKLNEIESILSNFSKLQIKFILTTRQYERNNLLNKIKDKYRSFNLSIDIFNDDQIEEIIKKTYNIFNNNYYLERITDIAKGNPRLAMMAGKVAVEQKSFESIQDVSGLYDAYFTHVEPIFGHDIGFLKCAGILAFLEKIRLNPMPDYYSLLFAKNGITNATFEEALRMLHSREYIDFQEGLGAKINDQCLATYLLKLVFLDKKIIPISKILECLFPHEKKKCIGSINSMTESFRSTEHIDYILQQCNETWDYFEGQHNTDLFKDFVAAFYEVRPTETLSIISTEINSATPELFDVTTIDFQKKQNYQSITDDILKILRGYHNRKDLHIALELLFYYYEKRPALFMQFYFTLREMLEIELHPEAYGFRVQKEITAIFIEKTTLFDNNNILYLFLKVASLLLRLNFFHRRTKSKGRFLVTANQKIIANDASKDYRTKVWTHLHTIYKAKLFQHEIEHIINDYASQIVDGYDPKTVSNDLKTIRRFFTDCFSPNELAHIMLAHRTIVLCKRTKRTPPRVIQNYIKSPAYDIYRTFDLFDDDKRHGDNWHQKRESKINEYAQGLSTETLPVFLDFCKAYYQDKYGLIHAWDVEQGIIQVLRQLENRPQLFIQSMEFLFHNNLPASAHDLSLPLLKILGKGKYMEILAQYNVCDKDLWKLYFFMNLEEIEITDVDLSALYQLLKEICISNSRYPDMNFIKKYEQQDPVILVTVAKTFYDGNNRFFLQALLMALLFGSTYSSDDIIEKFGNNNTLLLNIYTQCIDERDISIDHNGEFICALIRAYGQEILTQYLDAEPGIIEKRIERLKKLWDYDLEWNYVDTMFNMLARVHEELFFFDEEKIANFFTPAKIDDSPQLSWLLDKIDRDHNKIKEMEFIFELTSNMPIEIVEKCWACFLKQNNRFEDFEQLPYFQRAPSEIWSGSKTSIRLPQLELLEKLLPHLSGIVFLRHKTLVEKQIAKLKKEINEIEKDEAIFDAWE